MRYCAIKDRRYLNGRIKYLEMNEAIFSRLTNIFQGIFGLGELANTEKGIAISIIHHLITGSNFCGVAQSIKDKMLMDSEFEKAKCFYYLQTGKAFSDSFKIQFLVRTSSVKDFITTISYSDGEYIVGDIFDENGKLWNVKPINQSLFSKPLL